MTSPGFFRSQLTALPYPTHPFTSQTIIITGSNTGMGLAAAHHFVRLHAAKIILAVRSLEKGRAAAASINCPPGTTVEVWELDLASYASVMAFGERARGLERLDVLVGNAGMFTWDFERVEGEERTVVVNVISTFLLVVDCLPVLRRTAVEKRKEVVVALTGSFTHFLTKFPERKNKDIFGALAIEKGARMDDRYPVSKLIELLCLRELAEQLTKSTKEGRITANYLNPGFVATEIMREGGPIYQVYLWVMKKLLSRNPEEGGRTLVNAAEGGEATHGAYLNDCKPDKPSEFVKSEEGAKVQKQLWRELSEKLEKIHPGVMQNI